MSNKKRQKRAFAAQQSEMTLPTYRGRRHFLLGLFGVAIIALGWRAADRQIFETDFLQNEGDRRHLRVVEVPAYRGMITDRNGEPLAISTPVDSIWANPRELNADDQTLAALSRALEMDGEELRNLLTRRNDRAFVYLKRRASPEVAEQVSALMRQKKINGLGLQREYRRYYPDGEVFAHVIGFTDIDDHGQEGLELAYDEWLAGVPGSKRVIRDGRAQVIEDVENISAPRPGKDLALSLDRRLQFLAYRELKAAVQQHKARSGSAVILDARTGEVLAMVNQPAYNPNGVRHNRGGALRNRAVTDLFEPGSTLKPFPVAVALELGQVTPTTPINTSPGLMRVGRNLVKDVHNYGQLDVTGVIRKSSNVGVTKIALDLPREAFWQLLSNVGFGTVTAAAFPGEAAGQMKPHQRWSKIDVATLSFGYGLSVTPLQLAQAYAVLAGEGLRRPTSLLRVDTPPQGERVLSAASARAVLAMLETVVTREGTALNAAVPGYRVGGKTGTVKKSVAGGYAEDRYDSVFVGLAPISDPRLVMAIVLKEPQGGEFYGGKVAAPTFARVMAGALRLLNVPPDALDATTLRIASSGGRP